MTYWDTIEYLCCFPNTNTGNLYLNLGYKHIAEEYFQTAIAEASSQLSNPRSDSAEALDRYGTTCCT